MSVNRESAFSNSEPNEGTRFFRTGAHPLKAPVDPADIPTNVGDKPRSGERMQPVLSEVEGRKSWVAIAGNDKAPKERKKLYLSGFRDFPLLAARNGGRWATSAGEFMKPWASRPRIF